MRELRLHETEHPRRTIQHRFDALVGLDSHKERLLDELVLLLDPKQLTRWQAVHHPRGLPLLQRLENRSPMVLLSGEVGCGKTELALSVGTPLADRLQRKVLTLETPTDIRGSGLVGGISARITAAFDVACSRVPRNGCALLVIDEADDLATQRAQMQAHHEDRAGLNVLVKQLNRLAHQEARIVVLLVTNRANVLDPAILRRAALHLTFQRPGADARRHLFAQLLDGTEPRETELAALVRASDSPSCPYSASDLVQRVAQAALREAWRSNIPFNAALLLDALRQTSPSPLVLPQPTEPS